MSELQTMIDKKYYNPVGRTEPLLKDIREIQVMAYDRGWHDGCAATNELHNNKGDIDVAEMLIDIYMAGVNMDGEYRGCYVRFKDIEEIVEKAMGRRG